MSDDHHRCDLLFAEAEQLIADGDWEKGAEAFASMQTEIERHFRIEEESLFPRFEEVTGMTMGPTQMMRHEHQQMRQLFARMATAVEAHDGDAYLGSAETLLILMQQHNAKEEQILYPMIDTHLAPDAARLLDEAKAIA